MRSCRWFHDLRAGLTIVVSVTAAVGVIAVVILMALGVL